MRKLSDIDWLAFRQRSFGRHRRILAAERSFHAALLNVGAGDICVDCGANVGDYSAFMARTGATVHAFEPDPLAFERLSARFADAQNVILQNAALACADGTAVLHRTKNAKAGDAAATVASTLLDQSSPSDPANDVEVAVIDFPAFLRGLPTPPKVVKIDIEGAEVAILEALFADGQIAGVGHVYVETHERRFPRLRARTFSLIREAERRGWANVNMDWA